MTLELLGQHPVRRAAQRFVLVAGAGALGAVVCATVVLALGSTTEPRTVALPSPRMPSPRPLGGGERAAAALLTDAAASAAGVRFSGRKIFGSWTSLGASSVLADVRHEPGHGTTVRVTSAGGADAEQLAPDGQPGFEQPGHDLVPVLTSHYRVGFGEPSPVAGRRATVVEAIALTTGQLAGRFWIDTDTGVLLRDEVYDAAGRQIWMSAYLELTIAPTPTPTSTYQGAKRPPAEPRSTADRLRRAGWEVPQALPGGLELYRATKLPAADGSVVQLTYLDGLFGASLFAQRGRLDERAVAGFVRKRISGADVYARHGLYRQYVWSGGDTVYTLVTDAPDAVVAGTVAILPHGGTKADVLSRMGRGIDRVGSWINPFE